MDPTSIDLRGIKFENDVDLNIKQDGKPEDIKTEGMICEAKKLTKVKLWKFLTDNKEKLPQDIQTLMQDK